MGMPNIPDINPNITITRQQTINLILASIALEELGLAHIINAEGEKIQVALTPAMAASLPDIIAIDNSANNVLKDIVKKEMLLQFKLEDIIDMINPLYTIVLTWGAEPRDLDSHITGPIPNDGRFHVYYANMTYTQDGIVIAKLDQDVVTGFGPETVTLNPINPGTYDYYVYNWSNEVPITTSNAVVKVYRNNVLVNTFNVPTTGVGRYWNVFTLTDDTITPVNEITNIQPS